MWKSIILWRPIWNFLTDYIYTYLYSLDWLYRAWWWGLTAHLASWWASPLQAHPVETCGGTQQLVWQKKCQSDNLDLASISMAELNLLIAVFKASAASDCETLPPIAVSYMNATTPRLLSWKLLDHVLAKGKCSKGCTGSFRAPLRTMDFTIGRSLRPIAIERGLLVHGSPFLHNQTKTGRSFFLSPSPKSPHTVFNKMWLQGRSASWYIFELQQDHVDHIWCIWQPYKWSHDFGTPQRCKRVSLSTYSSSLVMRRRF